MRSGFIVSLLSLVISRPYASADQVPLTLLGSYDQARCLDGSSGGYYFRPAASGKEKSWVFSLQGGGECVNEDDCAGRATSSLGSSDSWDRDDGSSNLVQFQDGYEGNNPDYYDWNHVFVMYCTGDLHLGTVTAPGDDQWGWAYFSGSLIVDAVIEDLKAKANLSMAETVIWSGDSAGGIGSAALVDYAAEAIPNARVVGAPIAGFYWNNSHPYTGDDASSYVPFDSEAFREYYPMWQPRLPENCVNVYYDQPWVCTMLNYSIPHATSSIFVIEFQTDSVQLGLHDGVASYSDETKSYVKEYGRNMTQALIDQVASNDRHGVFSASCFLHTSFYAWGPYINDMNFLTAFSGWLSGNSTSDSVLMDDCCSSDGDDVDFNPTCPSS